MIFHSGLGFLVVPIIFGSVLLTSYLHKIGMKYFEFDNSGEFYLFPMAVIPFLSIKYLDKLLRKRGPVERVPDINGHMVDVLAEHSFMFLPLKWFARLWLGLFFVAACLSLWSTAQGTDAKSDEAQIVYIEQSYIEPLVIETIAKLMRIPKSDIKLSDDIKKDLGVGITKHVLLIHRIEERFDISIPQKDSVRLIIVADIVSYLEGKTVKQKQAQQDAGKP